MDDEFDVYKNYTSTTMLAGVDEDALTRWSVGYFHAQIVPHLPPDHNAEILEIGCGYGRNLLALKENGYVNVSGIDVSEEQIAYAVNRLGLKNASVGDAELVLDGVKNRFDAILLLDVLEHLELSYSVSVLKGVLGALKPGGVLVVQVPNAMSPLSPNRYGDITHLRAYTPGSMSQHLRMGGFARMEHFELPPHIHGVASFVRRMFWSMVLKPGISAYMLAANSSTMGGVYTANMLTVATKDDS